MDYKAVHDPIFNREVLFSATENPDHDEDGGTTPPT